MSSDECKSVSSPMDSFLSKVSSLSGIEDVQRYWDGAMLGLDYVRLPLRKPVIKLGLCCINTILRKKDIYNSRTCIRRTYSPEKALELASQNIIDMIEMFKWNAQNGIWSHRLSSDICPHYTDQEVESYTLRPLEGLLKKAGQAARYYHQRITFHPGQYTVLAPEDGRVLVNSVRDLQYHADILDLMGCGSDSVMMIHGGGVYKDKEGAVRRWIDNYTDLSPSIKRRLCLENCEKCYSVADCLHIHDETGIPIVLDNHHYHCYDHYSAQRNSDEKQEPIEDLIPHVLDTWGSIEPLFHISQQAVGERIGKHSDYISELPGYYLDIAKDRPFTLEVEAKMKEQAILPLIEKHHECRSVYPSVITLED
jgi:UV DNA damage endonuclease